MDSTTMDPFKTTAGSLAHYIVCLFILLSHVCLTSFWLMWVLVCVSLLQIWQSMLWFWQCLNKCKLHYRCLQTHRVVSIFKQIAEYNQPSNVNIQSNMFAIAILVFKHTVWPLLLNTADENHLGNGVLAFLSFLIKMCPFTHYPSIWRKTTLV